MSMYVYGCNPLNPRAWNPENVEGVAPVTHIPFVYCHPLVPTPAFITATLNWLTDIGNVISYGVCVLILDP